MPPIWLLRLPAAVAAPRGNALAISPVKHAASSSTSTARRNLAQENLAQENLMKARDFSLVGNDRPLPAMFCAVHHASFDLEMEENIGSFFSVARKSL
ncbi:MAG: hypothetical protein PHI97_11345 [Desulfobulbus sp.]|nr:hypothetical protein [Desulfobulbus sp.]